MPTLPTAPIPTAILGFGLAGKVFHAPFISAVPTLALAAIMQRTGESAKTAYPYITLHHSIEETLASPAQLIVVATPNETHFDFARRALNAGKHVVIDKPFAATAAEARELESLAASKNLIVAPFHNRRFDGDFLTLKKLLAAQTLGRPVTLESHFDRFRPIPRDHAWKESPGPFNGLLWDLGPHLVDQALALFGKPDTLTASVRTDRDTTHIEDAFDITLTFTQNHKSIRVHLRSTMIAAEYAPRYTLHGTHGSYTKFGVDPQEPTLVAGARVPHLTDTQSQWLAEPESAWGTLTLAPNPSDPTTLTRTKLPTELGDYRHFYANVAAAIHKQAPLAITPRDAIHTLHLLELARQSSKEGRTLPIENTGW